jgi:cyclic lactone autoinducer peptide
MIKKFLFNLFSFIARKEVNLASFFLVHEPKIPPKLQKGGREKD